MGPWVIRMCFPIAVWLQSPANAGRYRAAGINLYVGLWKGPTEEQLRLLRQAGMSVICEQNAVGLAHLNDPIIVGWMHGDEPDNAQSLGEGKGYGPPIPPEKIVGDYERIRAADPTRPVMLNLGQGVAWDGWYGRGVRTNHPEDYPEYVKGCDIVSFDIYPVAHDQPEVAGKLWYVAHGVERLVAVGGGRAERSGTASSAPASATPNTKPTPPAGPREVWMSIIHGSQGLIYFVHEWQPRFNEAALLSDPDMLACRDRHQPADPGSRPGPEQPDDIQWSDLYIGEWRGPDRGHDETTCRIDLRLCGSDAGQGHTGHLHHARRERHQACSCTG